MIYEIEDDFFSCLIVLYLDFEKLMSNLFLDLLGTFERNGKSLLRQFKIETPFPLNLAFSGDKNMYRYDL